MDSTRRQLLVGAGAVALGTTVAPAEAASPLGRAPGRSSDKPRIVRLGRAIAVAPDGRVVVVAHARRRTIDVVAGRGRRLLDIGGQPLDIAISPDGHRAAITRGHWDQPGLAIVDLRRMKVLRVLDVGASPFAPAFTPDGKRLVVTGGERPGTVHVLDGRTFRLEHEIEVGGNPRGLALGRDDAYVALHGANLLVRIALDSGRVTKRMRAVRPDRLALSDDGGALLASHSGARGDVVTELSTRSSRRRTHDVGRLVSGVGWTSNGKAVAALGGSDELVVLGRGKPRTVRVGPAPRGLAIAGRRAWTVSGVSGEISEVRL